MMDSTSRDNAGREPAASRPSDSRGLLAELTQVLALLAALAGVVYVLGGSVPALWLERADTRTVVGVLGQLPRSVLSAISLTAVVLPALLTAVLMSRLIPR